MELSEEMQSQAKALADPTRFGIFRYIVESDSAVRVAELTSLLGFNHNAIRQHLAILVEAGLISETNEQRTVRGRPRKQYTVRSDALRAFRSISGSYQRLAELLLTLATSDAEPYEVGFAAAVSEHGGPSRKLALEGEAQESTTMALFGQLATDGFEPALNSATEIRLQHCPFADLAADAPSVVCDLHRGLIDGYLSGQAQPLRGDLTPGDPHTANCRITIENKAAPAN